MNDHVFISYSRTDSAYLRRLTEELTRRGIHHWVDHRIDYGDLWENELREKAETCTVLVVVMTPEAEQSEWVPREVHWAESQNRRIMPLLLDGEPLRRLAGYQHEDVRGGRLPSDNWFGRLAARAGWTPPPAITGSVLEQLPPEDRARQLLKYPYGWDTPVELMALPVETTTTLRRLGARTARDIPPLEQEGELTGRVEGFNLMMLQAALEAIKTEERL